MQTTERTREPAFGQRCWPLRTYPRQINDRTAPNSPTDYDDATIRLLWQDRLGGSERLLDVEEQLKAIPHGLQKPSNGALDRRER
jgi:hypothetical protein